MSADFPIAIVTTRPGAFQCVIQITDRNARFCGGYGAPENTRFNSSCLDFGC